MTITKKEDSEKITIFLEGRLDKIGSPALNAELNSEIGKNKDIVVDFTNLEYISSAGLRILISCEKQLKAVGKSMQVVNANEDVMNILKVTGFIYILNIKG